MQDFSNIITKISKMPAEEVSSVNFLQELERLVGDIAKYSTDDPYRFYIMLRKKIKENTLEPHIQERYRQLIDKLRLVSLLHLSFTDFSDFIKSDYVKSLRFDDVLIMPVNERIRNRFIAEDFSDWRVDSEGAFNAIRANEELIGTQDILITRRNEKVKPFVKNWIQDYDQNFGFDPRSSTDIVKYLDQSKNVALLNKAERAQLLNVITLYEDLKVVYMLTRYPEYFKAVMDEIGGTESSKRLQEYYQKQQPVKPQIQQVVVPKPAPPRVVPPKPVKLPPLKPTPKLPPALKQEMSSMIQPAQPAPLAQTPAASTAPKPPQARAEVIPYYAKTILEKIIRVERLKKLSDEQTKRLELIIGQVLRELKTKDDAAKTLEAPLEQGGIGFAKNQAQRIAGLIIPFAAEARQTVIRNTVNKQSLSEQKLREVENEINQNLAQVTQPQKSQQQKQSTPQNPQPAGGQTQQQPQKSGSISMYRAADLAQLSIAQLRGAAASTGATNSPAAFIANLATLSDNAKQMVTSRRALLADIIKYWKLSEPYRTYLEIGRESTATKKEVAAIARERSLQKKPYLTEQEFVAIADFMKGLQTIS